jgi:hypothetical protein
VCVCVYTYILVCVGDGRWWKWFTLPCGHAVCECLAFQPHRILQQSSPRYPTAFDENVMESYSPLHSSATDFRLVWEACGFCIKNVWNFIQVVLIRQHSCFAYGNDCLVVSCFFLMPVVRHKLRNETCYIACDICFDVITRQLASSNTVFLLSVTGSTLNAQFFIWCVFSISPPTHVKCWYVCVYILPP